MASIYVSHTILRRAVTEPGTTSRVAWLLRRYTGTVRAPARLSGRGTSRNRPLVVRSTS